MIVDREIPYIILEIQNLISLEGTIPYSKASAVRKKFNTDVFIKNFNNIVQARK